MENEEDEKVANPLTKRESSDINPCISPGRAKLLIVGSEQEKNTQTAEIP